MKKLLTILAFIAAIFTVLFSVLPISNLAVLPGILALIFAGIAYYLSKKEGDIKKLLPFTFLLTILALGLTTYKAIFTETVVEDTKVLEETELKLEEEAIEELEELEIEELEIDDSELEAVEFDDSQLELENLEGVNNSEKEAINSADLESFDTEAIEIDESELEDLEID
ncbi:hypothetical protein [Neotamlana nanhaiensis]|uniref:hypothetical protein n=1 Tax=Neotamlana nanhaiensis TaxID=1382798 RepID=UPI000AFB7106|nr:hypothetical protein [Tamlana nanhaiensis]